MNIYLIGGDPDYIFIRFQSVDEVSPLWDVKFKDTKLDPSHVVKLEYCFREPEEDGVMTDCPNSGTGHTLVLSRRAVDALGPMLDAAGALVEIQPSHAMGYKTFICYRRIDALDAGRCLYMKTLSYIISRYEFKPDALEGADIFRLQGQVGQLFVTDHFIGEVRKHRLSGFRYRRLWSSDTGGVLLDDPVMVFEQFPPGAGRTLREKRQIMRDMIASEH